MSKSTVHFATLSVPVAAVAEELERCSAAVSDDAAINGATVALLDVCDHAAERYGIPPLALMAYVLASMITTIDESLEPTEGNEPAQPGHTLAITACMTKLMANEIDGYELARIAHPSKPGRA